MHIPESGADPFAPSPDHPEARRRFVSQAQRRWRLTEAEATVLWHTCRGVTTLKDLAALQVCEPKTIRNHRWFASRVLGATAIYHAVRIAWPAFVAAHAAAGVAIAAEEEAA